MKLWRWSVLPQLAALVFAPKPDEPLPIWASKNVILDRRVTTRPGYYDPEAFPWTFEFQEILRTRQIAEKKMDDGAIVIVDLNVPGATVAPVRQITVMKGSVGGFTEGALNEVRFAAKHDPQNVIFAIDSRVEAGAINEIRLQPSLKKLGEQIFTDDDDDASKFMLKLRRMLIYFLGSYSAGAFANKMAELVIADELEEHGQPSGDTSNVENLRSRIKSAARGLLALISKPKLAGGPIDAEYKKGSMHIPEVPCPYCTEKNDRLSGYQELEQDNMIFSHCKNPATGEWDLARVESETYFKCIHCGKPIEEKWKRWMNDRSRRRWRRSNENAEPGHISFQVADFYSYLISWGALAIKYIRSKGDPVARQGYRNHNEGKAYELQETKTEAGDILKLRGDYKRGQVPWVPDLLILGADVGLTYVKWDVTAFRRTADFQGAAAVIDWGQELSPSDIATVLDKKRYLCRADKEFYKIDIAGMDAKYRKDEVHRVCLRSRRRIMPTAGISADLAVRSIALNRNIKLWPKWYGVLTYVDRDAKHELYTERIGAWVNWMRNKLEEEDQPETPRLWFPSDLIGSDDFLVEHTKEHLVEIPGAHAAKQFEWKRRGPNHWGDASKVALVLWRWLTRNDPIHGEPHGAVESDN